MYQCSITSPRPSRISNIEHPAKRSINHTHTSSLTTEQRRSTYYTDTSALLPKEDKKFIQEVIGTFIYYVQFVNSTMLAALVSITTQQANPTNTMKKVQQFLDYASTHPDAIVTYHVSDMVLAGHSDTSNLFKSNAHSWARRRFFMSNNTAKPPNNCAILTIAQIIKAVMSSAAEAEMGALYINCRKTIPARHTLKFMGYPQPLTPMQMDITTALGIVNNNVIKKLKAMDMKYHWLCNREC
jgi:hypothetical protein